MKIKDGFILTEVGEYTVAVPIDETAKEIKGIIRLNKTASLIWSCLNDGMDVEQIAEKMMERFSDVDNETACSCIEETIEKMKRDGLIEE